MNTRGDLLFPFAMVARARVPARAAVRHFALRHLALRHLAKRRRNGLTSFPLAAAVVALTAFFAVTDAHAGGISAGTLIENTATATYEEGGAPRTITSNTVTVRVDELLDVTVTSLDSGPIAARPGEAVLTYEVTNQGNGPEAFELIANPSVGGNDFETAVENLAIDSNGNGVYDPGVDEILASPQTTPVLAPDETIRVFIIVTVPDSAGDEQLSDVDLTASAVTGNGAPGTVFAGEGEGGGDAIAGTTTASAAAIGTLTVRITALDLVKSVSLRDPFGGESAVPGTIATFILTANVRGTGSIEALIITDAIPDGTTYAPGSLQLDTAALTDASGDDAGEASDADGIRVNLGTVSGGTTRTVTFDVTID
ncbi:MAG: hypothetical protein AAFY47_08505 [Pseudomonadota bacterium]